MEIVMRILMFAAFAALGLAGGALAEPLSTVSSVEVTLSPELRKKAVEEYGLKDLDRLTVELRKEVEQQLARTGVLAGGRVELILVDAKPNRPTMKQLGDKPGLSYQSYGIGGAEIAGRAIAVDGAVTPISYRWYETDIRDSWYQSTWADAEHAFDRFARRLGRGAAYAQR